MNRFPSNWLLPGLKQLSLYFYGQKTAALLICAMCFSALSPNSMGLESDKSQPITIQADYAEISEAVGTAIYQGNVQLNQGSLQIYSDRIVVFSNDKKKVEKVVATGSPASFEQQLESNKPKVVAKANDIEYQPLNSKLILSHQAELTQGDNLFEGERIEYNIKLQILNASGDIDSAKDGTKPKTRVKMVLPPPTEE